MILSLLRYRDPNVERSGAYSLIPKFENSSFKPFIAVRWFLATTAAVAAWLTISPVLERRSGVGLDLTALSNKVILSLEDTPHRYDFMNKEQALGLCPGARCPLNTEIANTALKSERKITGNISSMTTSEGWRKVMYVRWDVVVPDFVEKPGDPLAFDFYGISGKTWKFFVNGRLVSDGVGGSDISPIVFKAPELPGSPMSLGFEIDVGRSLAPGIVHIAQVFISQPEAAGKFRQAYRGLDHASVLPSATGFALLAMLAGLGCFFTPFYKEIMTFSVFVTLFNWRLLMVNDMTNFPHLLKVDFVTVDAMLRSILFGTMWAFWGLYFRVKTQLKWLPLVLYITASLTWYIIGRTGVGLGALIFFIQNVDINQVFVFAGAAILAMRTWNATRKVPWAKFRSATSLVIAICAAIICASFIAKMVVNSGEASWQIFRANEKLYFFANYSVRAFILGIGMLIALEWALIVRDRQKVLQRFGTIVDPRMVNDIIRGQQAQSNRLENVIVLFVDLRSFTKICDTYSPERVTTALNSYLDAVTLSVQSRDGIIDKFVGDAVMATWGAPTHGSSDPINALRAAMNIRLSVEALNKQRLAIGEFPLQIGIGIHIGSAIFGPIGNGSRVDHTVIGPAVNVASRVQDLTKHFGCDILISKEFYDRVHDECLVESLGSTEIRGMARNLNLFKVIGVCMGPENFVIGDKILEETVAARKPGVVTNTPRNLVAFDHDVTKTGETSAISNQSKHDKAA